MDYEFIYLFIYVLSLRDCEWMNEWMNEWIIESMNGNIS